ncbi:hypothetical protein BJX70DRAFT_408962 [Aspergillus crustosus]
MRLATWWAGTLMAFLALAQAQTMPQCASECLSTSLETSASAQNATSTLCGDPIRDKSLVAPIATAVACALAIAFVLLRVYDCTVRKEYKLADLCAVSALIFSLPMDIFEFFMMASGMGKDIWTLTPTQITNTVKYIWWTQVFYIPAIILTKVAILCFFMQVFPNATFRKLCQGTIVFCFLFMTSITIAAILACVPAINIATDLWVLALPIPMLLKLQLKARKKVYLVLMFSVGIIITVMSIVRFSGLITYSTSSNPTYNNVIMVATYSVIECNISIMCCCMPALRSCLRRSFPNIFNSTDRSRSLNYNKTPFSNGRIQKSVTHKVSYMPRAGHSDDAVELVDRDREGEVERKSPW